jgi:hypothetical protein
MRAKMLAVFIAIPIVCLPCWNNAGSLGSEAYQKSNLAVVQGLVDDYANLVQKTADVLAQIADEKTAGTAIEKLNANAKSTREGADKLRRLGQLTAEENMRLSSKAIDEAAKSHADANRKLRAFLEAGNLSKATDASLRKALLEWSAANFAFSEAMLSIAPPKKGKK